MLTGWMYILQYIYVVILLAEWTLYDGDAHEVCQDRLTSVRIYCSQPEYRNSVDNIIIIDSIYFGFSSKHCNVEDDVCTKYAERNDEVFKRTQRACQGKKLCYSYIPREDFVSINCGRRGYVLSNYVRIRYHCMEVDRPAIPTPPPTTLRPSTTKLSLRTTKYTNPSTSTPTMKSSTQLPTVHENDPQITTHSVQKASSPETDSLSQTTPILATTTPTTANASTYRTHHTRVSSTTKTSINFTNKSPEVHIRTQPTTKTTEIHTISPTANREPIPQKPTTLPLKPTKPTTLPLKPTKPTTLPLKPTKPTTLPLKPTKPTTLPLKPTKLTTLPLKPTNNSTMLPNITIHVKPATSNVIMSLTTTVKHANLTQQTTTVSATTTVSKDIATSDQTARKRATTLANDANDNVSVYGGSYPNEPTKGGTIEQSPGKTSSTSTKEDDGSIALYTVSAIGGVVVIIVVIAVVIRLKRRKAAMPEIDMAFDTIRPNGHMSDGNVEKPKKKVTFAIQPSPAVSVCKLRNEVDKDNNNSIRATHVPVQREWISASEPLDDETELYVYDNQNYASVGDVYL